MSVKNSHAVIRMTESLTTLEKKEKKLTELTASILKKMIQNTKEVKAVSYTHLTLPTRRTV